MRNLIFYFFLIFGIQSTFAKSRVGAIDQVNNQLKDRLILHSKNYFSKYYDATVNVRYIKSSNKQFGQFMYRDEWELPFNDNVQFVFGFSTQSSKLISKYVKLHRELNFKELDLNFDQLGLSFSSKNNSRFNFNSFGGLMKLPKTAKAFLIDSDLRMMGLSFEFTDFKKKWNKKWITNSSVYLAGFYNRDNQELFYEIKDQDFILHSALENKLHYLNHLLLNTTFSLYYFDNHQFAKPNSETLKNNLFANAFMDLRLNIHQIQHFPFRYHIYGSLLLNSKSKDFKKPSNFFGMDLRFKTISIGHIFAFVNKDLQQMTPFMNSNVIGGGLNPQDKNRQTHALFLEYLLPYNGKVKLIYMDRKTEASETNHYNHWMLYLSKKF